MALAQPSPHEPNPPSSKEISTDSAEQLVLLGKHKKERLHQLPAPRREIYLILAKVALGLIPAISYLTFCFIVLYRDVPVGRGVDLPFVQFSTVSVITTTAILIVYVALWPVQGVIDEIRAEEFFRLMDSHPNGVPFDSVNAVSSTTTGVFDIFIASIHRHCSPLLTSTLFISLAIAATSSLAPATLSAGSKWIDVDNSTLLIGALPKDSIIMDSGFYNGSKFSHLLPLASTMAWVENTLNFTNGYYKVDSSEGDQFDQFEYLVPFPPEYTSTMKAYWTTDVIVLDPSCSWQPATTTGPNLPIDNTSTWDVMLLESNMSITLWEGDFVSTQFNSTQVSTFVGNNPGSSPHGSMLFVIDQLGYPMYFSYPAPFLEPMDLSSIPTLKISTGNGGENVLAFLLCSPHVSIQTRQVRAIGNGNLTLGKHQPSQGNIDFYQANYLLSFTLLELPFDSGPTTNPYQAGTDLMLRLIFDTDVAGLSLYPPPAPLTNITAVYKRLIHSAVKTFLSGAVDTEIVPGGYTEEEFVFTSSLGHIITSAISFVFVMIALVAAQFRKGRVPFTLVHVAAALADSDVPQNSVEMTQFKAGMGKRKVLKLVPGGDGRLYCVYESVD